MRRRDGRWQSRSLHRTQFLVKAARRHTDHVSVSVHFQLPLVMETDCKVATVIFPVLTLHGECSLEVTIESFSWLIKVALAKELDHSVVSKSPKT